MALNLQQIQKQTQRLIMTPQMQQSIQLLQLTSLELEQLTEQELLENPFLTLEEEGASDGGDPDAPAEKEREPESEPERDPLETADEISREAAEQELFGSEDGKDNAKESSKDESKEEPPSDNDSADNDNADDTASLEELPEQFDKVDVDWEDQYSENDSPTYSRPYEDEDNHDFNDYVAAPTSLADDLTWQLRCSALDEHETQIGEFMIGSLNEDGYLEADALDDAMKTFGVEREAVERVLSVLQEFDPPGVFARDLAECLLLQMRSLDLDTTLAEVVLRRYFSLFQKKKFREIARKLETDEPTLQALYRQVSRLEPYPGRSQTKESAQYIKPDVFVKLIDDEMMIYLNEGRTAQLSVDRFYRRLIRQQQAALTAEDREYALERFRSALTLIKNIEKRKSTIMRVTEAIMNVQREFLDKGVEALKPLTLREIAEMVEMHESTIARVTSRKYVDTPQGLFQLKYFFSSSIETQGNAEAVSSRSIKDKIANIVEGEDTRKPYSDQKIADMLKGDGFEIARRTVAKYREQLKILPAKYRRDT